MVFQFEKALCKNKYHNISLARMVFLYIFIGRSTQAHPCPVLLQSCAELCSKLSHLKKPVPFLSSGKPFTSLLRVLGAVTFEQLRRIVINFPFCFYCLSEAIWDFISLLFHRVWFS